MTYLVTLTASASIVVEADTQEEAIVEANLAVESGFLGNVVAEAKELPGEEIEKATETADLVI